MKVFIVLTAVATLASSKFKCPIKDGQYEDDKQCDMFYECVDGVATTKLCPDDLVFDPTIRKINKCDQPFNVDCGDRTELQPPNSNIHCPRLNGFFAHPNASICDVYYECIDGKATEVKCTPGLRFAEDYGTCVWSESAGRLDCATPEKKTKDGFERRQIQQLDSLGEIIPHPMFPRPNNCQCFYVCLYGVEPRNVCCQVGYVYDGEHQRCDAPENVPGCNISGSWRSCEDWYKVHEAVAA